MGPSFEQLACDILQAKETELPLVLSCQPYMCVLGLRCQPGDICIHAGPPLIGTRPVPLPFGQSVMEPILLLPVPLSLPFFKRKVSSLRLFLYYTIRFHSFAR